MKQCWSAVSSVEDMQSDNRTLLRVMWFYCSPGEVKSVSYVFSPFDCAWQFLTFSPPSLFLVWVNVLFQWRCPVVAAHRVVTVTLCAQFLCLWLHHLFRDLPQAHLLLMSLTRDNSTLIAELGLWCHLEDPDLNRVMNYPSDHITKSVTVSRSQLFDMIHMLHK